MHLSAPFIQRPVATSLLSLALLLAGSVAYSLLPVASLPDVDFPVISASAGLPGIVVQNSPGRLHYVPRAFRLHLVARRSLRRQKPCKERDGKTNRHNGTGQQNPGR